MKLFKTLGMMSLTTAVLTGVSLEAANFNNQPNRSFPNQQSRLGGTNDLSTQKEALTKGPTSGKLSDQELASKIRQTLQNGQKNYNDNITVTVEKGKVKLDGTVDSYEDIELVEERINKLGESIALENNLEIKPDSNPSTRWNRRDFRENTHRSGN